MTTSYMKPLPYPTPISETFWNGLNSQKILIQQCDDCGGWFFYPRKHCTHCWSNQVSFKEVSGQATLYTYTISRVPTLPEFSDEIPQMLAVVELQEGVRMNTVLVGLAENEVKVGMKLKPVFHHVTADKTLLKFTGVDKNVELKNFDTTEIIEAVKETITSPQKKIRFDDIAGMKSLISEEFSPWSNQLTVDQNLINEFAKLSGDDYWIHTDPEKSKKDSPFGTTIAHGALVQILMSRLKIPMAYEVTGFNNIVNYGSDRLRFPSPVPSGVKIYARSRVKAVSQVKSGTQVTLEICTHIVGHDRPSVINDLVMLYM
jgi:uncharacterized OB-fold protein/acyl dehydratase